jgi:hypothetical protein
VLKRPIRIKVPQRLPRAMEPYDVKCLMAVLDGVRNRAMILALLRTGMRIGELLIVRGIERQELFKDDADRNSRDPTLSRRILYLPVIEFALKAIMPILGPVFIKENLYETRGGPPRHPHHNQEEWFDATEGVPAQEELQRRFHTHGMEITGPSLL